MCEHDEDDRRRQRPIPLMPLVESAPNPEEAAPACGATRIMTIPSIYGDRGDPTLAIIIDQDGCHRFWTVGQFEQPDFDDFFPVIASDDGGKP